MPSVWKLERPQTFMAVAPGSFEDQGAAWGVDDDGATRGAIVADFNNDGFLDLFRRDLNGPNLFNASGLPSPSFRTDDWPMVTQ